MKTRVAFLIITVVLVLAAAGLFAGEAKALGIPPEFFCMMSINIMESEGWGTGYWVAASQQCYLKIYPSFPDYDMFVSIYGTCSGYYGFQTVIDGFGGIEFLLIGCFGGGSSNGNVFTDPLAGQQNLGDGAGFGYDANTCDGKCSISRHGLTPAAKNALGELPGKVIGKTFVQIKDKNGDLDIGNFTLCLPAKSANTPAFYRFVGSGNWSYIGGYWKGDQFCMAGTMSGNYVLVD
jgi:hypothetical protein